MSVTKRIFPRPPAQYGPGPTAVAGPNPYTYTRTGGLDALTVADAGVTGVAAQMVQGLYLPFDPIPDMDFDTAPIAVQFGAIIFSPSTTTFDFAVSYLGGSTGDQAVNVGVIVASSSTPTLYTFDATPTQLAEPELPARLLFGLIVLSASIGYVGAQPAGILDAAWLDVTYTPTVPLIGVPFPTVVTSVPVVSFTASGNWYQDDGAVDLNVIGDGKPLRFYSPSNSSDSITVNFSPVNLGPNPIVGGADVYVVGGGTSPTLGASITVHAADGSVIQTITGAVNTSVYSSWFTLLPDVRLAGGCSISFTVPPQAGSTYNEFCISAVILELRTTSPFNSLSLQQGSGLARFDDVQAMR